MSISRIFPFAVAIFVASQLAAQSPAPATLVKAGRLLDPRTGNVLSPAAVLIENDKIKEVGAPAHMRVGFVMNGGQVIRNDIQREHSK